MNYISLYDQLGKKKRKIIFLYNFDLNYIINYIITLVQLYPLQVILWYSYILSK
jgi:hypothetical protein